MRLVIATPLYPPEPGGPATYVKLLEEGLPLRGIEVQVVKFSEVRALPKLIRHIVYESKIRKALKNADAVLALDPVSVGLPAMRAAQKERKPLAVKIVGDYAWEQGVQRFGVQSSLDAFAATKQVPLPIALLRKVQKTVAQYAQHIIVPSAYLKEIVQTWGIAGEQITVIHNAVSVEHRGTVPHEVVKLPRPFIVSVGRLVPWKGMDGVIDAVSRMRTQGTDVSLVIAGDGPQLEALREKARTKLHDNYVFTGKLSHEDTLALMHAADVFVLNSSYEGLSHVLIEARLLGTPIVATDAGGNAEVVEGALVPVNDTQKLSEALTEALQRGRESLSKDERFVLSTMLDRTAELLKTLV